MFFFENIFFLVSCTGSFEHLSDSGHITFFGRLPVGTFFVVASRIELRNKKVLKKLQPVLYKNCAINTHDSIIVRFETTYMDYSTHNK